MQIVYAIMQEKRYRKEKGRQGIKTDFYTAAWSALA
jgi:hypothetical protein